MGRIIKVQRPMFWFILRCFFDVSERRTHSQLQERRVKYSFFVMLHSLRHVMEERHQKIKTRTTESEENRASKLRRNTKVYTLLFWFILRYFLNVSERSNTFPASRASCKIQFFCDTSWLTSRYAITILKNKDQDHGKKRREGIKSGEKHQGTTSTVLAHLALLLGRFLQK